MIDFGWDLPPGVTTSMCEANIIDENTLCGCGHKAMEHDEDGKYPCRVDDCECKEFTDDWEPDWDSMPGGADDPDRVRRSK